MEAQTKVKSINENSINISFQDTIWLENNKTDILSEVDVLNKRLISLKDGSYFYEHYLNRSGFLFESEEDFNEIYNSTYIKRIDILLSNELITLAYSIKPSMIENFIEKYTRGELVKVTEIENTFNRFWYTDSSGSFMQINVKRNKMIWINDIIGFEHFYEVIAKP